MARRVGSVAEVWRYPVKGMRGERLPAAEFGLDGMAGDRRLAYESSSAPRGKPLLTGRERAAMLLYHAAVVGDGVCVTTAAGETFAADDPALLRLLEPALPGCTGLALRRSARPQTDVRPLALLSMGAVAQLAQELGGTVDARRFRANLLLNLQVDVNEADLAGHVLQVGASVRLRMLERTPRCRIVTLDPDTAEPDATLMRHLDRAHNGRLGVYAAVEQGGAVQEGDGLWLG